MDTYTFPNTPRSVSRLFMHPGVRAWGPWLGVIIGLVVLYGPTLYDLLTGLWSEDEQMHGPLVLAISLWLIYRNWGTMQQQLASIPESRRYSGWGWVAVGVALVSYALGRSQGMLFLEVGSLPWLLAGLALLGGGTTALRCHAFALFFMCFMVPLPAAVVETVTLPMKTGVSFLAEHILYALDYPISRSGVTLQVGQYSLLVADACAGLHTLLTLEALGLLYLHLVRRDSAVRNVTLALLIVPISITANVIRVMALCLVTYHLGDAAGQGFLHGFAGMALFLSALLLIISVDGLLHLVAGRRRVGVAS